MHFTKKTALEKRSNFVQKLQSKKLLRFPGAYNPLCAKVIAEIGFDGVYIFFSIKFSITMGWVRHGAKEVTAPELSIRVGPNRRLPHSPIRWFEAFVCSCIRSPPPSTTATEAVGPIDWLFVCILTKKCVLLTLPPDRVCWVVVKHTHSGTLLTYVCIHSTTKGRVESWWVDIVSLTDQSESVINFIYRTGG